MPSLDDLAGPRRIGRYALHAEFGHPVDRIHEIAQEWKSDLVVMGSRGLTAWPALLIGSVSEGVAEYAPCPVLIVRGEPKGFRQIVIATDVRAVAPIQHAVLRMEC